MNSHHTRINGLVEISYFQMLEAFLDDELTMVRKQLDATAVDDAMTRMVFEGILMYLDARLLATKKGRWAAENKAAGL